MGMLNTFFSFFKSQQACDIRRHGGQSQGEEEISSRGLVWRGRKEGGREGGRQRGREGGKVKDKVKIK